ncbi:FAD-binding protein [Synechococcus sp. KORDI-52]|uniref:FAD-binding oxidoreductase n=1 Tax=Synechococcus sp. KORDI-52 TaxID=585425 RepID=UPI0004E0908F|nr:FAD-binding oxidoreductase [Synechococcus sp. KORDI-52]AII49981.1 FAD-binding protein [Synechococcus sp. KORDI-52]
MGRAEALIALRQALSAVPDLELFTEPAELQRHSRDAFEYSPVLTPQLQSCRAELVVRPKTVKAVERLASACADHQVPLTLRGTGTGNYGQCVPLHGGVVMLTAALRQIRSFDAATGVVTVEPGCVMRDLDQELRRHGRQLRLMPSTWRSATIGGFIAGGSGGIGSSRWGFLRDPGHLLGMEVVPLRPNAQCRQIDEIEAEALNHAYGTNGIITALSLATAPAVHWHQVSVDCDRWEQAIELMQRIAASAVDLHLATLLEQPLLARLPTWAGPVVSAHRLLLLVAPDGLTSLQRMAQSAGGTLRDLGPEDLSCAHGLRELSWNHTTLHVRASEPGWTYLQMLLPQPELPAMAALKQRWGDALIWHLELVRQQGCARLAALPLVRWQGEEQLCRLMHDCKAAGAVLFNPHVITVEDGGLGVVDADQVAAKHHFDPAGLLNPGKLRGWDERL